MDAGTRIGHVHLKTADIDRQYPFFTILADAYTNGGALFLLWDEGSSQGDDPPFIVVSPNAKRGFVSQVDYDTSAYLKTVQTLLGVEPVPCSPQPEAVPTMDDLFTAPMTP